MINVTDWKELSRKWKVDVRHGGYHVDGTGISA